jgi:hypothetical protein
MGAISAAAFISPAAAAPIFLKKRNSRARKYNYGPMHARVIFLADIWYH